MNRTVLEVYVVIVPMRVDGIYAFALREDAEAFAVAAGVEGTVEAVPLIPGGGAGDLIAAENDDD